MISPITRNKQRGTDQEVQPSRTGSQWGTGDPAPGETRWPFLRAPAGPEEAAKTGSNATFSASADTQLVQVAAENHSSGRNQEDHSINEKKKKN